MLLKSGHPRFETKHISALWKSKIPDLKTLKERIPNSLLVALDLEFSAQGVSEVGLAFLRVHGQEPQFQGDGTLQMFYSQNEIQVHSFLVRDRIPTKKTSREAIKYGTTALIDAEEVVPTVTRMLSTFSNEGSLILIGFALYAEFQWISQECPSLSTFFTTWVDLQEIAEERSGALRPGLIDTMSAMHIFDREVGSKGPRMHRASNDAVRCMAVLSGLVSLNSFTLLKASPDVLLLTKHPHPSSKHPFTARITTSDGSTLPSEFKAPRSLSTLFEAYKPKAVALKTSGFYRGKLIGLKVWWLSFSTACRAREPKGEIAENSSQSRASDPFRHADRACDADDPSTRPAALLG